MTTAKRAFMLAVVLFWTQTVAYAAAPMGFDDARLLLNRTSFGAGVDDIDTFAKLTRAQAVDRLLVGTSQPPVTPPPSWVNDFESPRRLRGMSDGERKAFQREQISKSIELRDWWMTEMLATPSPLTEKMTLFWHNHFVSSQQKVKLPVLMYRQNVLLRRYALGNFAEMLHAVARDPAMLVYLDGAKSRREQPNENFAREVMELFTLGEGHYSERDIKEAARAFTGWSIDPDSGEFVFRPRWHDDGVKTVLGHTGNFDGDAVLDILLEQPQTAEFIVAKMWREFVSPDPDPAEVKRIARLFRDSHYDIKIALQALLTSGAFYAPQNRAALIKSPVDLIVGTLREFRFGTADALPFVVASRQLGQDLFAPPNVKGWPGGETWINSATLLARKQLLARLFRGQEMREPMMRVADRTGGDAAKDAVKPGAMIREQLMRAMASIHFDAAQWLAPFQPGDPRLIKVVLAADPVNLPPSGAYGADLLRQLVLDPVYQLK